MTPAQRDIARRLRADHARGVNLGYRSVRRSRPRLAARVVYHFGSWSSALEAAGIDPRLHSRNPFWTKDRIIRTIKSARRASVDLTWSEVIARRDDLSRAAHAAIRRRNFGSWSRALQAAGVDPDLERKHNRWDRQTIAFELRLRHAEREPMNSAAVQCDLPALHAAALRHFGSFDAALRAARIDPDKVRLRFHR